MLSIDENHTFGSRAPGFNSPRESPASVPSCFRKKRCPPAMSSWQFSFRLQKTFDLGPEFLLLRLLLDCDLHLHLLLQCVVQIFARLELPVELAANHLVAYTDIIPLNDDVIRMRFGVAI